MAFPSNIRLQLLLDIVENAVLNTKPNCLLTTKYSSSLKKWYFAFAMYANRVMPRSEFTDNEQ